MHRPQTDATLAQFSLRSLLVVTLIVGVASAVAARMRDALGAKVAAIWVGVFVVTFTFGCWRRIRTERRGGRLLLRCHPARWKVMVSFTVWIWGIIATFAPLAFGNSSFELSAMTSGLFCGLATLAAWGHSNLFDHSIEFFERGLVLRNVFLAWDDVRGYGWIAGRPGALWIRYRNATLNVGIRRDERAAVDSVLAAHVIRILQV
jgi:hypothetical protein